MIDIVKILRNHGIDYRVGGDHKHVRPGWIGIACPFCSGNPGYHLGYSVSGEFAGRFVCWRCGGKSVERVLEKVLRLPKSEIKSIISQNQTRGGGLPSSILPEPNIRKKAFKYPSLTKPLLPHHKKYLTKRGFNPDELVDEWGLLSTGPIASLVTNKVSLDYSHRIIIPIEWHGRAVSFQGRDVTGKHPLKYLACPKAREVVEHKNILYGNAPGDQAVLVEGVTDVWKLGEGALSCFGVKFRLPQIKILARKYKELFILFDPDKAGNQQAKKIKAELEFRGVTVHIEKCGDTDPGDMSYEEAHKLMELLGF